MTFKDGLVFGLGFFTAGLVFTIVVGILSLMFSSMIAGVMLNSSRSSVMGIMEEGSTSAMKSDLRNLAAAEEAYFADNRTYTSDIVAVDVNISRAVTLIIHSADGTGWGATATHSGVAQTCALYYGSQYHKPAPAEQEGVVKCS